MTRLAPYPLLTLCLLALWLLLNQSVSPGHILLGTIIALLVSRATTALSPETARIRYTLAIPRLALIVLTDIIRSNIAVGQIILSRRNVTNRKSGFVSIPLDMQSRHGLAVLGIIITATPGTLWMEHDPVRKVLLIHVLDLIDKKQWVSLIKGRYERLLMEIFE